MSEEARSSAAVFIPANDVFGNANGGSAAHEVDFFRRLSGGGDAYVAYRLDPETGVATRYEYSLAGGAPAIAHSDQLAAGVGTFAPSRVTAGSMSDVVSAATVSNVSILYGTAGVVGGNDVVVVRVQARPEDGVTPAEISVHLASRAAPTSLSVLAPAAPPPPVGSGPITIPFIIRNVPIHIPHGPWHSGSSGTEGDPLSSGVHQPWMSGSVSYFGGGGSGLSWLDLLSLYPTVENGIYTYRDSSGILNTVTITCDGAPCPRFKPLPSSGSPPAPPGGVGFDAVP
jgi:hypothetical protein